MEQMYKTLSELMFMTAPPRNYEAQITSRIKKILDVAASQDVDVLILEHGGVELSRILLMLWPVGSALCCRTITSRLLSLLLLQLET